MFRCVLLGVYYRWLLTLVPSTLLLLPMMSPCACLQEGIDSLSPSDAAESLSAFDATVRRHASHAVFGGTEVRLFWCYCVLL